MPAGAASGADRGQGHCYEGALGARGVPPVSKCKFTETQGTAARLRLCPGQPGGSGGSSPAVQRGGEPAWGTRGRGTVPAVRPAGLVLAVRATACGVPRAVRGAQGRADPRRAGSPGWAAGWGRVQGPGDPAPGWGSPRSGCRQAQLLLSWLRRGVGGGSTAGARAVPPPAGASPRRLGPAAPAASSGAGGSPGACAASPATAPAWRRTA